MLEKELKKHEGGLETIVLDDDAWGSEFGIILKGIQERERAFLLKARADAPTAVLCQNLVGAF